MKKYYYFFESNIGISLLFTIYFFLRLPTDFNLTAIRFSIGESLGALLSQSILIFVLSRKFKWNRRKKLMRIVLLGLFYMFLMEVKQIQFLFNLFNIVVTSLFILIVFWEVIIHFSTHKSKNISDKNK